MAKFFLVIINLFHKPKEGVFNRDKNDKDFCYWSLRAVIRKWPIWLARQLNLPILETLALKVLGLRTFKLSCLNVGWIDCEFIELGKNIRIGQGSVIMSNIIIRDKLIIKKVILEDNVIIGAHSVVSPGTKIERNSTLDALSLTSINQRLNSNSIYSGIPAEKIMENRDIENKEILLELIFKIKNEISQDQALLRTDVKELSVPFHVYIISGWWIVGGSFIIPGILFFIFIYWVLIPNLFLIPFSLTLLFKLEIFSILLLTPIALSGIYLIHLFFVALFTSAFYRFADYRGPAQGVFDRNLHEQSKALDYYHWRSFLLKYPVFAFLRSPFPWLINWELKFIGSNKIGKRTVFEECFIHSHLNFGKDCYMGTYAHISNHVVDGVYGSENLTFYGARIGDNCIFNALIGGMPGLEVGNNATFLPMATTIKYDKLGDDGIYFGFPLRKLSDERIKQFMGENSNRK
ncbi:MAG: hypothetical protein EU532_10805 [Promethearchaeota archaeon]|nr:MAG: hypothetical protein EU532_10805 [Candidatus Lokiarchaeota archaeon]